MTDEERQIDRKDNQRLSSIILRTTKSAINQQYAATNQQYAATNQQYAAINQQYAATSQQ